MNHTASRLVHIPSAVIVIAAIVTSYSVLAIIITIIVYVNTGGRL